LNAGRAKQTRPAENPPEKKMENTGQNERNLREGIVTNTAFSIIKSHNNFRRLLM